MVLSPIQELRQHHYEWFTCECGTTEFLITQEYSDVLDPKLGVIQKNFDCKCGASYIWESGRIRIVNYGQTICSDSLPSKLQELMHRRTRRWTNLSLKTFENDIHLLTSTVRTQHEKLNTVKKFLREKRAVLKSNEDSTVNIDSICDEITAMLKSL